MNPRALLLVALLATAPAARDYGEAGPLPVGWLDTEFLDENETIYARLFYPALEAGPGTKPDARATYPLHGFLHGWGNDPSDYDAICTHLASWGWVVASVFTDPFIGPQTKALNLQALLHWTQAESPVANLLLNEHEWSVSGHSLGGAAAQYLVGIEPRVRTVVAFQGIFVDAGVGLANLAAFDGALYYVAGDIDRVAPWQEHGLAYFEAAQAARRAGFALVPGMDHGGVLDNETSSAGHRVNRRALAALCAAEQLGEENAWNDLAGGGIAPEVALLRAHCPDSSLWFVGGDEPGEVVLGQAARPGELVVQWVSIAPAAVPLPTPYGDFGLDPVGMATVVTTSLDEDAWTELAPPPFPTLSGVPLWAQGIAAVGPNDAALTRTASLTPP